MNKKEALKELIKRLHKAANPEEIKNQFKEVIRNTTPTEIAQVEEELIKEGMPREEIQRLCDVHLSVFQESLEKEESQAPAGHPIHTLMEEHKMLLKFADKLISIAKKLMEAKGFDSVKTEMEELSRIIGYFKESESHYLREENVLFPYLEKHGVTQPPAIMWMEHNQIREIKKNLFQLIDNRESLIFQEFTEQMVEVSLSLADMLSSHFYKENGILFPTALKVIGENEWKDIIHQFGEIGYCSFTPESARITIEEAKTPTSKPEVEGLIIFATGSLAKDEIGAIFNSLPVDITFVDAQDTVRYFSQTKERIFLRTEAVIGLKVQQCHPQKSIHVVNQILKDFKSGKSDVAEFWIDFEGRFILIRYFPVRNENGDYMGCVEVTQDITDIKKIEGEKRLL